MIFGPEILAANMILTLASAKGGAQGCVMKEAPAIRVDLKTDNIVYNYSRSAAELSREQINTVSPYAPGTDSISGGLRIDKPEMKSEITWNISYNQRSQVGCMWYDDITISLHLRPHIYVAREFNKAGCREAILEHERKHVEIDRRVMNKYAASVGRAVQAAVDQAGILGPFNMRELEKMKAISSKHIESAIASQSLLMDKEMAELQGQVDSLEEYQRVSSYCKGIEIKTR